MFVVKKIVYDTTSATVSFTIVFLSVFLLLHRYAELHEDSQPVFEHWRPTTSYLFCAPAGSGGGVQVMMDLYSGGLCVQVRKTELLVAERITYGRFFALRKFHLSPEKLIFALGAKL